MSPNTIFISCITLFMMFAGSFVIGSGALRLLKIKPKRYLFIPTGILVVFALNEIIALPFMLTKGDYQFYVFLFSICLLILLVTSFFSLSHSYFKEVNLKQPLVIALILMIIEIASVVCFTRIDADDAFYVAVSTSIQATGRVFLNNPSIGLNQFAFPPNYLFTSYEVFVTYVSTLSGIAPSVLYHTVLPIFIIPVAFNAYYALGKSFLKKNTEIYILIFSLLILFSGYSNFLPGSFLILRAWMGKTLTITISYPMVFYCFNEILKGRNKFYSLLCIFMIAGMGLSAVGLFLMPVSLTVFYLSGLFLVKNKKKFTVYSILTGLPALLLALSFYIVLRASGGLGLVTGFVTGRSYFMDLRNYFGGIFLLVIYLESLLLLIYYKKSPLLFIFPGILFLSFLNPLFKDFIAEHLTSEPTYWRLFWLLPIFPTISYLGALVWQKKRYYLLVPLLLLMLPVDIISSDTKFLAAENDYKISTNVITAADTILDYTNTEDPEDLYLLSVPHYNIYLREYTGKIALVMPRLNYVEEAYKMKGEENEFNRIRNLFAYTEYGDITGLAETLNPEELELLGITLVLSPEEHPELDQSFKRLQLKDDFLYIKNEFFKEPTKKSQSSALT